MIFHSSHGRFRRVLVAISITILLALGPIFHVEAKSGEKKDTIRVLILKDFPPQFVTTPDGPSGLAIDVVQEVARRASLDIEFVSVDSWKDVFAPLKNQTVDVLASMGVSAARREFVDFGHPYEVFHIKLFVRKGVRGIDSLAGLGGRRLGLQATNVLTKGLVHSGKYNIKIYPSFQEGLLGLLSGEIDALPAPEEPFMRIARKAHLDNLIQPVGHSLREVKRAMAVPKGRTELRDRLNKGLDEFKRTDDYRFLLAKWYGAPTPYWNPTRIALLMGVVLAVSLFTMGVGRHLLILRLNRRIRNSEERFKDFARISADWLWESDEKGIYTYISDGGDARAATGFHSERILGKKRTDFFKESIVNDPDIWNPHLADIDARRPVKNFQYSVPMSSGEQREFLASAYPILDADGTFKGYRGVTTDISELKTLENQLRQSQKMDVVGQLTGGVAHDFNNMLSVIMGNIELLRRKVIDDPAALELVEGAYQGTVRGATITRKLLAFSGTTSLKPQVTNVNECIDGMAGIIASSITAKIAVVTGFADDIWAVNIDPGDFEDALLNLSLNARDAMPDGGSLIIETVNIALDERYARSNLECTAGDYVMVSVSDTGVGMTRDVMDKIYQPFFTSKREGRGTGLGLSMVYGFVQRSGGHIKAYSEPDEGTTFHIYLPRATGEATMKTAVSSVAADALPRGNETILIVEDEAGLRKVATSLLEGEGYKTVTAANGEQALQALREKRQRIDLLFSDVVLPGGIDGYDIANEVLTNHPGIKILMTSGFTARRQMAVHGDERLFEKLSKNLLHKPYRQTDLIGAVRRTLDSQD